MTFSDEQWNRLGPIYCWECGERTRKVYRLDVKDADYARPQCPGCRRR